MQAITLEVILRVVFGVPDGPRLERLRAMLTNVLQETASPRRAADRPRARAASAAAAPGRTSNGSCSGSTSCSTPRSPSTAPAATSSERDDILSMLMQAEFEDGGTMDDRSCATS